MLRMSVFFLFAGIFVLTLIIMREPLYALPLLPSVLLSFWIWEDGEGIEELKQRVTTLEEK